MQVNEAIARAKQVIFDLFGAEGILDLNLEEVALNKKRTEWLIVCSFLRPPGDQQPGTIGAALANVRPRHRKMVRLQQSSGELIAVTDSPFRLGFEAA